MKPGRKTALTTAAFTMLSIQTVGFANPDNTRNDQPKVDKSKTITVAESQDKAPIALGELIKGLISKDKLGYSGNEPIC